MPTLNAQNHLPHTLKSLVTGVIEGLVKELIIIDGGSNDATLAICEEAGARCLSCEKGRGLQLKTGGEQAKADWLLFIHADTVLDDGWVDEVQAFINDDNKTNVGIFTFALNDRRKRARVLERIVKLRCKILALPYGDQGLLISKSLYEEVGGFKPMVLMEDVDIISRLGRSRLVYLKTKAITDAARYKREGYLSRMARNFRCLSMWYAGVAPEKDIGKISMMGREQHLVIMAKKPVAGNVKSRLGKTIGTARATGIYRHLMSSTIARLGNDRRWQTSLAIAPDTAIFDQIWPPHHDRFGQGSGNLGQRMQAILDDAPIGPVIIIGTDIPDITPDDIAAGFKTLGRCDVVFGPAGDGGFWLVGAKRSARTPQLFSNVRWSSEHALNDTVANARGLKIGYAVERADIDTEQDLIKWRRLKLTKLQV